ncbi:MAG: cell division protein FtsZ, partial [Terriglobia bacterium]
QEVHAASSIIQQAAHEVANIIFGAVLDETLKDHVKITVIATGYKPETMNLRRRQEHAATGSAASLKAAPGWNAGPQPVNRAELLSVSQREDLDVPAFLRRRPQEPGRLETR